MTSETGNYRTRVSEAIDRLRKFRQATSVNATDSAMAAREERITKLLASEAEFLSQMQSTGTLIENRVSAATSRSAMTVTPSPVIPAIKPAMENMPNTDSTSQ